MTSDASRLQWKMWQVKKKKKRLEHGNIFFITAIILPQPFANAATRCRNGKRLLFSGKLFVVSFLCKLQHTSCQKTNKIFIPDKRTWWKKCLTKCRHTLLAQDSGEKKKKVGGGGACFLKLRIIFFFFSISLTIFIFQSFTGIQFSPT